MNRKIDDMTTEELRDHVRKLQVFCNDENMARIHTIIEENNYLRVLTKDLATYLWYAILYLAFIVIMFMYAVEKRKSSTFEDFGTGNYFLES